MVKKIPFTAHIIKFWWFEIDKFFSLDHWLIGYFFNCLQKNWPFCFLLKICLEKEGKKVVFFKGGGGEIGLNMTNEKFSSHPLPQTHSLKHIPEMMLLWINWVTNLQQLKLYFPKHVIQKCFNKNCITLHALKLSYNFYCSNKAAKY